MALEDCQVKCDSGAGAQGEMVLAHAPDSRTG
jgi:hypothetical protein